MDVLTVILLSFCVGHCYGQNRQRKLAGLRLDVDYLRALAIDLKFDIDDLQSWKNATFPSSRETGVIASDNKCVDSQLQGSFEQSLDAMEERMSYIKKGLEGEKVVVREMMEHIRQTDAKLNEQKLSIESKFAETDTKLNQQKRSTESKDAQIDATLSKHILTTETKDAEINEQLNRLSNKLETSIGEVLGQLKDISARLDTTSKANGDTREQITHSPKQTSTTVQDTTVTMKHRTELKQAGWLQYNNSLYKPFTERVNFSIAVKSCESNGASLVEITDMAELTFIADNFRYYLFWLGATYLQTEGEWRWLSGQRVKDGNWYRTDPGNYRSGQDCLMTNRFYGYKYRDFMCSYRLNYICKIQ